MGYESENTELERGATLSNACGHIAKKRWGGLIRNQQYGKPGRARLAVS